MVFVWLSSSQSAAMARVRCGELCGARTTRNSFWVTSRSAALAKADWIRVRPSSRASAVVRGDQSEQITLGLIGHHLDQVGQVLSFRSQFDDWLLVKLRTGTRRGTAARRFSSCTTRCQAFQIFWPSFPCAVLKPRMVRRWCSRLVSASRPYSAWSRSNCAWA